MVPRGARFVYLDNIKQYRKKPVSVFDTIQKVIILMVAASLGIAAGLAPIVAGCYIALKIAGLAK